MTRHSVDSCHADQHPTSWDRFTPLKTGKPALFLAGRGLTWWLIGFSLIAANISTEQFVGMSGQAADWLGFAIASYEWMAAITLVVVAFVFLPKLLRCGIYTIPEFLEYRYGPLARWVMAFATLVTLVGVPTASVISCRSWLKDPRRGRAAGL